ncbi:hypothetical protein QCN29_14920 [Streptomyces sp. HNM0663]|uniref:Antitoxin Xre/MbcA/ParS-like toxin-binding domain-containing protein n=1 Tax=Streptomyces chengmaiensis TaxID=3040919 RepID=A0ABT6HMX6_9ACTN|nr:hypothetical protein [Streptomyces chengmaiensis]MDH2390060.1 hypothetical protein [Streptomyces chengmaiensis]
MSAPDPVGFLAAQFGPRLAARLTTPRQQADAARILQQLAQVEGEATARAWMVGMNPHLDNMAPIHAITDGRMRDVEAAARAYLNGDWT